VEAIPIQFEFGMDVYSYLMLQAAPDRDVLAISTTSGMLLLVSLDGRVVASRGGFVANAVPAFSPDGRSIVVGSADGGSLSLVDARTLETRLVFAEGVGTFKHVAFSPDGRTIVSSYWDGTIRLWRAATGEPVAVLRGHEKSLRSIAFLADGRRLVSGGRDGTVRLWDVETGEALWVGRVPGEVYDVAEVPGRDVVASTGADGAIRLWDTTTGRELPPLAGVSHGNLEVVGGGAFLLSSDLGSVSLWDLSRALRDVRYVGGAPAKVFSFDPVDGSLVTGGADGSLRRWDTADGGRPEVIGWRGAAIWAVAHSPDGRLVASGDSDGVVRLWDLAERRETRTLRGNRSYVDRLSFSPDGRQLSSGGYDGTVRTWDVLTGAETMTSRATTSGVIAIAYSPDGRRLAAGTYRNEVAVLDAATGERTAVLEGHASSVYAVCFDAAGSRVAAGAADGKLLVWDLATGTLVRQHDFPGWVSSCRFRPDGRGVEVQYSDPAVRWGYIADLDLQSGETSDRIAATGVRSADGRFTAWGSGNAGVVLFDSEAVNRAWRTVLLLDGDPPVVLTHRGWETPGGGAAKAPPAAAWTRALEERGRWAQLDREAGVLCMIAAGRPRVELWDTGTDTRLAETGDLQWDDSSMGLAPVPAGCAMTSDGRATLLGRDGQSKVLLGEKASWISRDADALYVATDDQVFTFDLEGRQLRSREVTANPTVVLPEEGGLVVGHWNGTVELLRDGEPGAEAAVAFESAGTKAVLALARGPGETLIGGLEGLVAIWSLEDGALLHTEAINDDVDDLLVRGDVVYAASRGGQHLALDLSTLTRDRCELLREVWEAAPFAWEDGRPVPRPAPRPGEHECAR
jgi:WD40 repeat protein